MRMIGDIGSTMWTPRSGIFVFIMSSLELCELAIIEGVRELNLLTFPVYNTQLVFFFL